jgi:putative transcription factor
MLVCGNCAKLGPVYLEEKHEPRLKTIARRLPTPILSSRRQPSIKVEENLELIEDFGSKIRQAREKLGLSHEDLGKKIMEKVSVLRKIESGKMAPDNLLVEKLKYALKINLLMPISEPLVPKKVLASPKTHVRTLGDIAQVKHEKEKQGRLP